MAGAPLVLRLLAAGDEQQATAAHEEMARDPFMFLLDDYRPDEPWAEYVDRVAGYSRNENVVDGRVPATFLVAEVDGVIVGRTSIRHGLNDHLARWGGHIGYGVRPAFRRRGYATEILLRSLDVARDVGLSEALVVCYDDNVGSATVIERCGGVLNGLVVAEDGTTLMRHYWVPCG
ncbi:MAG: GNAT family N-acetyltransferase [Actinobacteria bacterium]|nr:GNAT family N-acetyltransferase [Actinomycetota bacterium]